MGDFIEAVKQWIKIDDTVRESMLKIREMKEEKKKLENNILEHMRQNDQEVLNISTGGTIRMSLSKTKGGLNEDYIRTILSRFTANPDESNAILYAIMNDRPQKERTYLKRSQPRGGTK